MSTRDELDIFYNALKENYLKVQKNNFSTHFLNSYQSGNRTVYQKNISETKKFDIEWVTTIESFYPSIDKITRDPRSHIRYDEDIIEVERAKKTSSRSIRHLAANTHLIRDIDSDLNVTPRKILVENPEQDYAVYENRFVASLIKRLFFFVRNRYEIIKNNVESFQKDHLNAESTFNINNTNVSMKIDLLVTKDLDDKDVNVQNHKLLERVERLNLLVTGLRNSQFMHLLKNAPDVHPPIMKTNVIIKNPDFRNAYNLWLFLDKYSILGYDVDVKEKNLEFDNDFISELEQLFLVNYVTVLGNQKERTNLYNSKAGANEYLKKKTKVATVHPQDMVKNPDLIMVEDNTLNEYFLNKYKSLFDKAINADNDGIKYDVDQSSDEEIKKALRQTIEICNALYASKFEISEEHDIFRRLVTETDIEKEYEVAKDQLRYTYLIHDVKRVDYNNSIRLERKKINELERINKDIIKKRIEERKYEKYEKALENIDLQIEKKKKEIENKKEEIKVLKDLSTLNKQEEDKLNKERLAALNRVNEKIKEYDKQMQAKFEEERKIRLKALEEEKARYDEVLKEAMEAIMARREMVKGLIQVEKDKARDILAKERALCEEEYNEERAKIDSMFDEYHNQLLKESEEREALEKQREKEEWASMLVSNYEERQAEVRRNIEYKEELARERENEYKRVQELLDQERIILNKELDDKKQERAKENEARYAEINKRLNKELEDERQAIEAEDQALRDAYKASASEQMTNLNKDYLLEVEDIKLQKQRLMALNKEQREKENSAILKVQDFENK